MQSINVQEKVSIFTWILRCSIEGHATFSNEPLFFSIFSSDFFLLILLYPSFSLLFILSFCYISIFYSFLSFFPSSLFSLGFFFFRYFFSIPHPLSFSLSHSTFDWLAFFSSFTLHLLSFFLFTWSLLSLSDPLYLFLHIYNCEYIDKHVIITPSKIMHVYVTFPIPSKWPTVHGNLSARR